MRRDARMRTRRGHIGWLIGLILVGGIGLGRLGAEPERLGAPRLEDVPLDVRDILRDYNAELMERRFDEAAAILRAGLTTYRGHPSLRFAYTTLLIKQGDHARAVRVLRDLLGERPGWASAMNNLAWLLVTTPDRSLRDLDEALALAQTALLLAPDLFHIWSTLAEVHYERGNLEASLRSAVQAWNLARQGNAASSSLATYELQIDRARMALNALTLME